MTAPLLTRRSLLATGATSVVGLTIGPPTAAAPAGDLVLETVTTELCAMFQRALVTPTDPERLRSIASAFRVLDAVLEAHDLKRHQRRARVPVIDGAAADHLARRLRARGFPVTGDALLRRHLDARARGLDVDALDRQAATLVTSPRLGLDTAALFDAIAASGPTGVRWRSPREGGGVLRPASSWNACGWFRSYGGVWGFLLGGVGFAFAFMPGFGLAEVGLVYAGAALFFDGATVYCEF